MSWLQWLVMLLRFLFESLPSGYALMSGIEELSFLFGVHCSQSFLQQNPVILVAMFEDLISYLVEFWAGGSAPASVLCRTLSSFGMDDMVWPPYKPCHSPDRRRGASNCWEESARQCSGAMPQKWRPSLHAYQRRSIWRAEEVRWRPDRQQRGWWHVYLWAAAFAARV